METCREIHLTELLPAGAQSAHHARRILDPLALNIDGRVLEDVRLLVSELVTNALRHSGIRKNDCIELEVKLSEPGMLHVEVCDPGPGFPTPEFHPGAERASGWGLYLLHSLVDRWGHGREKKNRVWFEIDRAAKAMEGPGLTPATLPSAP